MIVSATGDPSNVDNFTAGEIVEDWRLVPNDNNIARAQRDVLVEAGYGDRRCRGFRQRMPRLLQGQVLCLSNSGFNRVTVTNITSSSARVPRPKRVVVSAHH